MLRRNGIAGLVIVALPAMAGCMAEPPREITQAETACLAATAAQVGVPNVTTLSANPTASGTTVLISVPGGEVPWRCTATSDGTIQEITYTGTG